MPRIENSREMEDWKDRAYGWKKFLIRYEDGTSEWIVGTVNDARLWMESHTTAEVDE